MDGESIAAVVAYHLDDYSSALEHIQNRREAIEEIKNHLDLHRKDRIYSEYGTFTSRWESNLRAVSFHCLCQLERFEEADELLHHTSPEKLYQKDRDFFLRMVLTHSGSLPSSGDFLRRCWEFYQDEKLPEKTQEKVSRHQALNGLTQTLRNYLDRVGADGWDLLAQMGQSAPGCSARIVLSSDPGAIAQEWAAVTDWEWIFPQAYLHTMELGLPLPDGFYAQSAEALAALATLLAAKGTLPRIASDWLDRIGLPRTPSQLIWQLDLATAALRTLDWKKDAALGEALAARYADLSSTYLDNIYNPDLLNEQDITVLPGMQWFGWWLHNALTALDGGDELGYVRALHSALEAAPAMKEMVNFLLDHKPKSAAQRQLEQLAEQLRTFLADRSPDDPEVQALKASEAYRKVASLLEAKE